METANRMQMLFICLVCLFKKWQTGKILFVASVLKEKRSKWMDENKNRYIGLVLGEQCACVPVRLGR